MDVDSIQEGQDFVYNVLLADKPVDKQMEIYASNADNYEQCCEKTLYRFPDILTQEFDSLKLSRDSKILDVGAGTGLNGRMLRDLGYANIDALDGCEQMLKYSKEKSDIYKHFVTALVVEEKQLPIPENSYDVALMAGSASPGHIDVTAYKQIIRVVKPGGIVGWILEDAETCAKVNARFHDNFYEKTLAKFVDEKLWVPIDGYNPKKVPNALLGKPGQVFFYKVL